MTRSCSSSDAAPAPDSAASQPRHDRALVLLGAKRNQVLALWEVRQYGTDSFGDPDHVSVYGMKPTEWHGRGVRLLGRTAVECTRDRLAARIAEDVAAVARTAPVKGRPIVLDPFAGSGNTLYWILRGLPGATGIGFEQDATVFALSRTNLALVGVPIALEHGDYAAAIERLDLPRDALLVVFVAPPWGTALSDAGLDLGRTEPPVGAVIDRIGEAHPAGPMLAAIQVYERLEPRSLAAVERRFDWSRLNLYDLDAPGRNHGLLVGTRGWIP